MQSIRKGAARCWSGTVYGAVFVFASQHRTSHLTSTSLSLVLPPAQTNDASQCDGNSSYIIYESTSAKNIASALVCTYAPVCVCGVCVFLLVSSFDLRTALVNVAGRIGLVEGFYFGIYIVGYILLPKKSKDSRQAPSGAAVRSSIVFIVFQHIAPRKRARKGEANTCRARNGTE